MIIYKEIKNVAQALNGNEFKVLMVMANDWAVMNKDGYYYRSMEDLAKDTNVSRRTLFRVVEGLKEKGYLDTIRRYGSPNWYKVNIIATEFDSAKMALSNKTDSAKIDTIDSAKMAPKKKKEKEDIKPCNQKTMMNRKEKNNTKRKDNMEQNHEVNIDRLTQVLKVETAIRNCINLKGKGGLISIYPLYQETLKVKDNDTKEVLDIISNVKSYYKACERAGKTLTNEELEACSEGFQVCELELLSV